VHAGQILMCVKFLAPAAT